MRLFLLLAVVFSLFTQPVYAATVSTDEASLIPDISIYHAVNYPLPYPGILPDSPLYQLKMLRDKVILFLIADPKKRAQFNLLQADKRMEASLTLSQKDPTKADLIISTLEKAENYFHEAVNQTMTMQKEGKEVNSLVDNLTQASQKHIEVLNSIKKLLPSKGAQLDTLIMRSQAAQKIIRTAE